MAKEVDFDSLPDPSLFSLNVNMSGFMVANSVQTGSSSVVGLWAQGSSDSIKAGGDELSWCAAHLRGTGNDFSREQAGYTTLQTEISNNNNNYGNVTSGGNSIITGASQFTSQFLSFFQPVFDVMDTFTSAIGAWQSGS